jgi:hypothetical protein
MQQDQEFPYFKATLDTVDTNSCNGATLLKVRAQIVLFNQEPQSVVRINGRRIVTLIHFTNCINASAIKNRWFEE